MTDFRGKPSGWLLNNSKGYPDFLFTILTYSLLLLALVSLTWIVFGILTFVHAANAQVAANILEIMDSMKTGLISLAGVVFGLAGSYTVRRFKKDQHFLDRARLEQSGLPAVQHPASEEEATEDLRVVLSEEDI